MSAALNINNLPQWLLPTRPQPSETEAKLGWLVLLRWLTVGVQAAGIILAASLNLILPKVVPVLAGLTLLLVFANLIAGWRLRTYPPGSERVGHPGRLLFWMLLDWVLFLVPISLVSGIHNPFFPLVFLHVTLAAVLLPTRISLLFLGLVLVSVYLLNPVTYLWSQFGGYIRLSSLLATAIESLILVAVWGFVHWVSLNLSHYRQQLQRLQTQQERLQRIHLLGALGAGVAHEFATPLNTLRLRLQRLGRHYDADQQPADLIAALQAQAQCESRLHNLASLPTAESLSSLKPLSLEPMLRELSRQWAEKNPTPPLKLDFALPEALKVPLPELALKQALFNLLDNAAQAAGPTQPLEICLKAHTGHVLLEVADHGPGWPEIVKNHLGEPFVTTRPTGTGLGLYSVYLLATALGGQLELLPNIPQGARARLRLPYV